MPVEFLLWGDLIAQLRARTAFYLCGMDDHAKRVCASLLNGWTDFETRAASLLDLARLAQQASDALDNANGPLSQSLAVAARDLQYAYYTNEHEEHRQSGRQILEPILAGLDN